MMPWNLEDWITDAGADVLDKRMAGPDTLSPVEELLYQIWLLDTEARNGGLSQYFCNHGLAQWHACEKATLAGGLSTFAPFAEALNGILAGALDPYTAIRERGDVAEDLWFKYQPAVVQQLKALCQNAC